MKTTNCPHCSYNVTHGVTYADVRLHIDLCEKAKWSNARVPCPACGHMCAGRHGLFEHIGIAHPNIRAGGYAGRVDPKTWVMMKVRKTNVGLQIIGFREAVGDKPPSLPPASDGAETELVVGRGDALAWLSRRAGHLGMFHRAGDRQWAMHTLSVGGRFKLPSSAEVYMSDGSRIDWSHFADERLICKAITELDGDGTWVSFFSHGERYRVRPEFCVPLADPFPDPDTGMIADWSKP